MLTLTEDSMSERHRLLIIDDDESNRILIKHYLADFNFDLFEADNGITCIRICQEQQIDIILLDIQMPGMNGIDVISQIKKMSDWYRKVPVFALTALYDSRQIALITKSGFAEYLPKPINKKTLKEKIKSQIEEIQSH